MKKTLFIVKYCFDSVETFGSEIKIFFKEEDAIKESECFNSTIENEMEKKFSHTRTEFNRVLSFINSKTQIIPYWDIFQNRMQWNFQETKESFIDRCKMIISTPSFAMKFPHYKESDFINDCDVEMLYKERPEGSKVVQLDLCSDQNVLLGRLSTME